MGTASQFLETVNKGKAKYGSLFEFLRAQPEKFKPYYEGLLTEGVMATGDALHLLAKTIDDQFQREVQATMIADQLIKKTINLATGTTEVIPKREGVIARVINELEAFPVDFSQQKKCEVTVYKIGLGTEISREMIQDSRFDVMAMQLEDTYNAVAQKVDYELIRCIQSSCPGGDNNVVTPGTYNTGQNPLSTWHPDTEFQGQNQASYTDSHIIDAGGKFDLKHLRTAMKLIARHEYRNGYKAIIHPYQEDEIRALDNFVDLQEGAYISTPEILNRMIAQGFIGSLYGVQIIRSSAVMPGVITVLDTSRCAVRVVREGVQIEREYVIKQQLEHAQVFTRQAPAVVDGNAIAQIYNCKSS